MTTFKRYVTCAMTFFIPLTYFALCHFYSITSHVFSLKITNHRIWKKKIFCIYGCFSVPRLCQQSNRSTIFFAQTLYVYFRYTNRLLDVFFLLASLPCPPVSTTFISRMFCTKIKLLAQKTVLKFLLFQFFY